MGETGVRPNRRLGQNFLVDTEIAQRIVALAGVRKEDWVVEIGPGLGSLTRWLLPQCRGVWAIERDPSLVARLQQDHAVSRGPGELVLVCADALQVDYRQLAERLGGGRLRLVANLPYCISSPLLFLLLAQRDAVDDMVFMLQKEVVDRLVAIPGSKEYGILTVQCALWMEAERLLSVPPESFRPRPRVDSAVVHLRMRRHSLVAVADEERFTAVVRAAFGQRRKTLANALRQLAAPGGAVDWLVAAEIDPGRRAETLSLAEFARLAAVSALG